MWTTSVSMMLCSRAWSSRKSNMYLMASGSTVPRWAVLKILSNRSSTYCWRVPCQTEATHELPQTVPHTLCTSHTVYLTDKQPGQIGQQFLWYFNSHIHIVTTHPLSIQYNIIFFLYVLCTCTQLKEDTEWHLRGINKNEH